MGLKEPVEVRLARVEEVVHSIKHNIDRNHSELMTRLGAVSTHAQDIAMLKRDRFWIFTIIAFLSTSTASYLLEKLQK